MLQNRCINDYSDYAEEQDYASAKHCCYNTDTQTSIKGPRDVTFLFSFLRREGEERMRKRGLDKCSQRELFRQERQNSCLSAKYSPAHLGKDPAQQQNCRGRSTKAKN